MITSDKKTRGGMYTWRDMRWCVVLFLVLLLPRVEGSRGVKCLADSLNEDCLW